MFSHCQTGVHNVSYYLVASGGAMSLMSDTSASWLAGLIDGEGCLDSPRGNPRIRVKMADHDVILRAAHLMGASTHWEIVPGRKSLLVAQITGEAAVETMRAILPYLGSRRTAKATELILAYEEKARSRGVRALRPVA